MTERITRTYEVEWFIYEPYSNPHPETVYDNIDELMEAARRRLLDSRELVWIQIGRRELEVADG